MSQVVDFLNEAKTFYFATVEGDQPRVRRFCCKVLNLLSNKVE